MTKKYLGLDPPKEQYIAPYLAAALGLPAHIPERRATFEALVPDRYKRPAEEDDDARSRP